MKIKVLYKYTNTSGQIIISPIQPKTWYTKMCRIIADSGKSLTTNHKALYSVIDVDDEDITNWIEVDAPDVDYHKKVNESEKRGN